MRNSAVLISVFFAVALILSTATTVARAFATTTVQVEELETNSEAIQETQDLSTLYVTSDMKQVNGLEFISRWGPVSTVGPGDIAVLLADCNPDEYSASGQQMFESEDVMTLSSFAMGVPDLGLMSWIMIVKNTDNSDPKEASAGVICVDEAGKGADKDHLDITVKTALQDAVNNIIIKEGDVNINIKNIVKIIQNITQVANIVNNVTGNNNTIVNVINQTAQNVANVNASAIDIEPLVNQTALAVVDETRNETAIAQAEQEIDSVVTENTTRAVIPDQADLMIEEEEEQEEEEAETPPADEEAVTPPVEEEEAPVQEIEEETIEEETTTEEEQQQEPQTETESGNPIATDEEGDGGAGDADGA